MYYNKLIEYENEISQEYTFDELRQLKKEYLYFIELLENDIENIFNTTTNKISDKCFNTVIDEIKKKIKNYEEKINYIIDTYSAKILSEKKDNLNYYSKIEIRSRNNKIISELCKCINNFYEDINAVDIKLNIENLKKFIKERNIIIENLD